MKKYELQWTSWWIKLRDNLSLILQRHAIYIQFQVEPNIQLNRSTPEWTDKTSWTNDLTSRILKYRVVKAFDGWCDFASVG